MQYVLALNQKRVTFALFSNRGERAVAGDDYRFVGQRQHRRVQRAQNFLHRAARQVGAADRTGEERVPGNQFLLSGEVQANAAFGVAGRVQNVGLQRCRRVTLSPWPMLWSILTSPGARIPIQAACTSSILSSA